MRLWSLHPSLLDRAGLVALWREALLAQKVLTITHNSFDFDKLAIRRQATACIQLAHLKQKLYQRDPKQLQLIGTRGPVINSTFKAVEGPIAPWKRTPKDRARTPAKRVALVQAPQVTHPALRWQSTPE